MSERLIEGLIQKKANKQACFMYSRADNQSLEQYLLSFTVGSNKVFLALKGRKNLNALCKIFFEISDALRQTSHAERVSFAESGHFMYCNPMQDGAAFLLGIYPSKFASKVFFKQNKYGELKVCRQDEKPAFRLTKVELECLFSLMEKIGLFMSGVPQDGAVLVARGNESDFLMADEDFSINLDSSSIYSCKTAHPEKDCDEKVFRTWLKPVLEFLNERALRAGQMQIPSQEQQAMVGFKQSLAVACKNNLMLMKIVSSSIDIRSNSIEAQ